jgi:hypothetical protein
MAECAKKKVARILGRTRATLAENLSDLALSQAQSQRHGYPQHAHTAHAENKYDGLALKIHPLQYSIPGGESQIWRAI